MAGRTPAMPDPAVPTTVHDPRHSPDASLADCRVPINFGPGTLLEEKMIDDDAPGTRGDETGIAAAIIAGEMSETGEE